MILDSKDDRSFGLNRTSTRGPSCRVVVVWVSTIAASYSIIVHKSIIGVVS